MGGQSSKGQNGDSSRKLLSPEEKLALKNNFRDLERSDGKQCPNEILKSFLEKNLESNLAERLVEWITRNNKETNKDITYLNAFIETAATFLRGSPTDQAELIHYLLKEQTSGSLKSTEVRKFIFVLLTKYINTLESSKEYLSWSGAVSEEDLQRLASYVLHDLVHPKTSQKDVFRKEFPNREVSVEDVENCIVQSSLWNIIQTPLFRKCFGLSVSSGDSLLPHAKLGSCSIIHSFLTLADVMFLNNAVAVPELRQEWRFLFSTKAHGESFSGMLGRIMAKGPTIVIVQDQHGYIFGGFVSQSWEVNTKFRGTSNSFLFHLRPQFGLYTSTGYNDHYSYLCTRQQTFPNGMGMGGQLEYFGLWLDSEFGKGQCSPSCTTFDSPQLSSGQNFTVEHVEVWGLGPEPSPDPDARGPSILDADPEGKAMLELLERGPVSDGMRDEDPTASSPGQHRSPTNST